MDVVAAALLAEVVSADDAAVLPLLLLDEDKDKDAEEVVPEVVEEDEGSVEEEAVPVLLDVLAGVATGNTLCVAGPKPFRNRAEPVRGEMGRTEFTSLPAPSPRPGRPTAP